MAITFRQPVDDNISWQQRLVNYAQNPDAGKNEFQRAMEVYRAKQAIGDPTAQTAKDWADKVNTAIGGAATQPNSEYKDLLGQVRNMVNQPVTPFQYNPLSDQQYQNALQQAQQNARTATNNAMVNLGSRGIGNSSIAVDRANQIQQQAVGNVTSQVLPQLVSQAYQRYMDQINQRRNQANDLLNVISAGSALDQQALDNAYRDQAFREQQKQNNIGNALQLTNVYGVPVQPAESGSVLFGQVQGQTPLNAQEFQQNKAVQEAGLTGMYNGNPTMENLAQQFSQYMQQRQLQAQLANQAADNARAASADQRSAENARINQLMQIWEATGRAPQGIPGVEPGTPLYDRVAARDTSGSNPPSKNDLESTYIANIDQMSPDVRKNFFTKEKANIIKDLGISGYNTLYKLYFDDSSIGG